jgi:hypothetical protein
VVATVQNNNIKKTKKTEKKKKRKQKRIKKLDYPKKNVKA